LREEGSGSGHVGTLRIGADLTRALPRADGVPPHRELWISIGCAVESAVVAARAHHGCMVAGVSLFSAEASASGPGSVGGVDVRFTTAADSAAAAPPVVAELAAALPRRHVCRAPYVEGVPLPPPTVAALHHAVSTALAPPTHPLAGSEAAAPRLHVVDVPAASPSARESLIRLVTAAAEVQAADAEYKAELLRWMRFNRAEAEATGDGLWLPAVGSPEMPAWLGRWVVPAALWWAGAAADAPLLAGSSAWALIATDSDTVEQWVDAGRAAMRLTLAATHAGVAHAYHSQVLEVPTTRAQLAEWLASHGGASGTSPGFPQLLLRLGTSTTAAWPVSLRRPLESVLRE
jgi:hypothetical protein